MRFAPGKRLLAFYSSMENTPFGANRAENSFFEKVCKSVPVFADYAGKGVPGGGIRGWRKAGLGVRRWDI